MQKFFNDFCCFTIPKASQKVNPISWKIDTKSDQQRDKISKSVKIMRPGTTSVINKDVVRKALLGLSKTSDAVGLLKPTCNGKPPI